MRFGFDGFTEFVVKQTFITQSAVQIAV